MSIVNTAQLGHVKKTGLRHVRKGVSSHMLFPQCCFTFDRAGVHCCDVKVFVTFSIAQNHSFVS